MSAYQVSKGRILSDCSYLWECAHIGDIECPVCCNLNEKKLIKSLTTARGQTYYGNLKAFLKLNGKAIYEYSQEIIITTGKFTPQNLLETVDCFNLPRGRTKIIAEWLEECEVLPTGTYNNLLSRGFKPTKS